MINRNIFSFRLTEAIEKAGMTKVEVATSIGIAKQSLNSWITGKALPSADKLFQVANLLNISIDYLLGRTDEK